MEAETEKAAMESVQEIQQTLREFPALTPGVLCAAFYIPGPGASRAEISAFSDALSRRNEPCDRKEIDRTAGAPRLRWASCYIPQHGEDAHFGHADAGVVIGVADGGSSPRRPGVDAAAFSRALMSSALAEVTALPPGESPQPKTLLEKAYTCAATAGAPGASTACILSLSDYTLRWAYVGNSGFAVLREGQIIHSTVWLQQRQSNCPVHLTAGCGESLQSAKVGARGVEEGDIVVAGTDGLFDNMSDREIEQAVMFGTALRFSPKNMADVIAGVAYEISRSKKKDSPFAVASRRQATNESKPHVGGKEDDITVVVAFV